MKELYTRFLREQYAVVSRRFGRTNAQQSFEQALRQLAREKGVAIFVLGNSEADIVEYAVDDARAFYIAEGGLERARGWLGDLSETDPTADPVGSSSCAERFSIPQLFIVG